MSETLCESYTAWRIQVKERFEGIKFLEKEDCCLGYLGGKLVAYYGKQIKVGAINPVGVGVSDQEAPNLFAKRPVCRRQYAI